ncbi:hypothetical protein HYH02_003394 [Chlamydomonas schloesseri]|uniref:Sugar phosphate transporter domain-containing protein n=1 Tax=Chlamydomonas schloesseri TaxID=2026947 RepID=A0A836B9J3_9CHLO|nr:hypothetical protein HYH02_003394 [Chlamydomonas schloesseri]|eukprot:KAG2451613.1 hypothetical protein HYH02_003394 [Chlamydomonas schloesseri]
MYNTLKRLTPVIVLVMKGVMDQRMPDLATTLSVLLIVGGCLVAGAGDLSFNGNGYSLAALCALMQATYILLAERLGNGSSSGSSSSSSRGAGGTQSAAHAARAYKQRESAGAPGTGSDVDSAESGGLHGHSHSQHHHHGAGGLLSEADVAHSTGVEVHANAHLHNSPHLHGPSCHHAHGRGSPLAHMTNVDSGPPAWVAGEEDGGSKGPLGPIELLYSICVIATVPLVLAAFLSGDAAGAPALLAELRQSMGDMCFMMWLTVTAVMEGLLTGMVIMCTQLNSALTTSVVGVLKGVVSSVLGFFLLGGVKFHIVNVAGMAMNMAGGVWYSFAQVLKGKSGG